MADIDLSQNNADFLIAMEKHCIDQREWLFPSPGERIMIPLQSIDRRESFALDVNRARVKLTKATYQNRARQAIVLLRLDIDGAPHRNPDGQEIPCPHLHVYREGYGAKWAIPAPIEIYPNAADLASLLEAFMKHCNITKRPTIQVGLF